MNITKLIQILPDSVKADTVDFETVRMKDGRIGTRVTLCRLLTKAEKEIMSKQKQLVGLDCTAFFRHAPEIHKSYFYII